MGGPYSVTAAGADQYTLQARKFRRCLEEVEGSCTVSPPASPSPNPKALLARASFFSYCKCGFSSRPHQPHVEGTWRTCRGDEIWGRWVGWAAGRGQGRHPHLSLPPTLLQAGTQPSCSWCLVIPASDAFGGFYCARDSFVPRVDITHPDNNQEELGSTGSVPGASLRALLLNSSRPQNHPEREGYDPHFTDGEVETQRG